MFKKVKKYEFPNDVFESLNSVIKYHPTWSFDISDTNIEKWNFFKNCNEEILLQLKSFEGLTWAEIEKASGGRKAGNNNHFVKINDLSNEAQLEIKKLKALDSKIMLLFSLRLNNLTRLYGIRDEKTGVYKIVWIDFKHEIYKINR